MALSRHAKIRLVSEGYRSGPKWRADNAKMLREWRAKHPGIAVARQRRYAHVLRMGEVAWADKARISLLKRTARLMTRITGIKYEIDHIVPRRGSNVCGLHVENNIRVVRRDTNVSKANRWLPDWKPETFVSEPA